MNTAKDNSSGSKPSHVLHNHLTNTASSLKCIFSWYLLVGSRICSLLYGASPQPGGQSGESWRLFHLGEDLRTSEEEQRQKRAHPKKARCVTLTFVDVRRQTTDEHFAGETLNSLPVLVGVTVGGAQDPRDTLVAVSVVEEIVINGEERRTACWGKKNTKHVPVGKSPHRVRQTHMEKHKSDVLHTHTEPKDTARH